MKILKALLVVGIAVVSFSILVEQNASAMRGMAGGDGAATFKSKCASCHGADGSGNTPMGRNLKLRNLGSAEVQAQSDAQLNKIISGGKGKMPGFGKSLGGAQIQELVAFIRSLKR
ncbi:MAG: cytochrome c [Acidobacteriota bacterium]